MSTEPPLPDVFTGAFDEAQVRSYFHDLGASATLVSARVKRVATGYSEAEEEAPTFGSCARAWMSGEVSWLQLVYVYEAQLWCDTLRRDGALAQLVRIAHQGAAPDSAT